MQSTPRRLNSSLGASRVVPCPCQRRHRWLCRRINSMQRRKSPRKSRRCRGCPFWAPPARCLDPALKSGWCGDWVWYMRGGKQCRRRYACPKDPHTLDQMRSRGRLTAVSRNYSQSLPDAQRDACIAAGAKLQSRPRLGQSGPLTGQQYWVRSDSARQKAQSKATKLKTAAQVPQTQRVTRSTSEPRQSASRPPPEQHRLKAGPARRQGEGMKKVECRRNKELRAAQVLRNQRITGTRRGQWRRNAVVTPSRAGRRSGTRSRRPADLLFCVKGGIVWQPETTG